MLFPADEKPYTPRRFLIDVEETIRIVLEQEDTDGDFQVSVSRVSRQLLVSNSSSLVD